MKFTKFALVLPLLVGCGQDKSATISGPYEGTPVTVVMASTTTTTSPASAQQPSAPGTQAPGAQLPGSQSPGAQIPGSKPPATPGTGSSQPPVVDIPGTKPPKEDKPVTPNFNYIGALVIEGGFADPAADKALWRQVVCLSRDENKQKSRIDIDLKSLGTPIDIVSKEAKGKEKHTAVNKLRINVEYLSASLGGAATDLVLNADSSYETSVFFSKTTHKYEPLTLSYESNAPAAKREAYSYKGKNYYIGMQVKHDEQSLVAEAAECEARKGQHYLLTGAELKQ